jgi:carboxyl-terminal processing protease
LQDLKRARIFGTRSAGAALPSDIIRLPDGDGFQYPAATYISANGRVLEGNGVIPDVEVRDSDAVIDVALDWILERQ